MKFSFQSIGSTYLCIINDEDDKNSSDFGAGIIQDSDNSLNGSESDSLVFADGADSLGPNQSDDLVLDLISGGQQGLDIEPPDFSGIISTGSSSETDHPGIDSLNDSNAGQLNRVPIELAGEQILVQDFSDGNPESFVIQCFFSYNNGSQPIQGLENLPVGFGTEYLSRHSELESHYDIDTENGLRNRKMVADEIGISQHLVNDDILALYEFRKELTMYGRAEPLLSEENRSQIYQLKSELQSRTDYGQNHSGDEMKIFDIGSEQTDLFSFLSEDKLIIEANNLEMTGPDLLQTITKLYNFDSTEQLTEGMLRHAIKTMFGADATHLFGIAPAPNFESQFLTYGHVNTFDHNYKSPYRNELQVTLNGEDNFNPANVQLYMERTNYTDLSPEVLALTQHEQFNNENRYENRFGDDYFRRNPELEKMFDIHTEEGLRNLRNITELYHKKNPDITIDEVATSRNLLASAHYQLIGQYKDIYIESERYLVPIEIPKDYIQQGNAYRYNHNAANFLTEEEKANEILRAESQAQSWAATLEKVQIQQQAQQQSQQQVPLTAGEIYFAQDPNIAIAFDQTSPEGKENLSIIAQYYGLDVSNGDYSALTKDKLAAAHYLLHGQQDGFKFSITNESAKYMETFVINYNDLNTTTGEEYLKANKDVADAFDANTKQDKKI